MERHALTPVRTVGRAKEARSRVTNGKQPFVENIDERSLYARRWHDLCVEFEAAIPIGQLNPIRRHTVRRIATAVLYCEQMESQLAQGLCTDPTATAAIYTKTAGLVTRLLKTLNIDSKIPTQDKPAASLQEHLAGMGYDRSTE